LENFILQFGSDSYISNSFNPLNAFRHSAGTCFHVVHAHHLTLKGLIKNFGIFYLAHPDPWKNLTNIFYCAKSGPDLYQYLFHYFNDLMKE